MDRKPCLHPNTALRKRKGLRGVVFGLQCLHCRRRAGRTYSADEAHVLDPSKIPNWIYPKRPGRKKREREAYYRGPVWRALSKQRLELDGYTCECGNPANEVHHLIGERFGGQELMEDLRSVCSDCHDGIHTRVA